MKEYKLSPMIKETEQLLLMLPLLIYKDLLEMLLKTKLLRTLLIQFLMPKDLLEESSMIILYKKM